MAKNSSSSRYYLFGALLLTILLGAATFAFVSQRNVSQENRGQASTCSEAPVDTQFRMYTGKDTGWAPGSSFGPKVGDAIDVNCFAKNGSALLSQAKITATVTPPGGAAKALTIPAASNKGAYLTNLKLTEPGVYRFTCANTSNTCTNTDEFTVLGSPPAKPTVQANCVNGSPVLSISWAATSVIKIVDIDDDTNWNNGFWNKAISSGTSTQAPDGFNPHIRTDAIQVKPNTQYQFRIYDGTTLSENATFTTPSCQGSSTGTGSGTGNGISDLNKNGKADPDDYRLFVEDYRKRLAL